MNLKKKKQLAARTFGVGAGRISFQPSRIEEIKEAITKQDIKDLAASGAIIVKDVKGRLGKKHKIKARGMGKVRKKIKTRKRDYMRLTRKLRRHVDQLKRQSVLTKEEFLKLRKQIRSKMFRSKAHMKELIGTRERK